MSLFTYKSAVNTCLKITNCGKFGKKCFVKIAVKLRLSTYLFAKKGQECWSSLLSCS